MDEQEARLILQAYRPETEDAADPHFAEALADAGKNPELARWLAEEQAFDRAMAAQFEAVPAPFGLKTRILAQAEPPAKSWKSHWLAGLAGGAALLFLFVQVVDFWRPGTSAGDVVPGYSREMVSFVKLPPPLEKESGELGTIKDWLAQKNALRPEVPARLAALHPVGCRVLSYRGHDVTLICFQRENGALAHLFVVDRAALKALQPGAAPSFNHEGDWTTASWAEGDRAYMIAVQGDETAARRYLPDA